MKRFLRILAGASAMAACLLFIRPALAQEDAAKDSTAHKRAMHSMERMHRMGHMGHMEHRIERMTEHLDLTDEQAAAIETLLEEHEQAVEELAERHRTLHEELQDALGETLTEEQMETLEEHMSGSKRMRGKGMKGKRGKRGKARQR